MAILKIGGNHFLLPVDHAIMLAEELTKGQSVQMDYEGGFAPVTSAPEISVIFTKELVPATVEDGCDAY